jgi:hypothetical protein
MNDGVRGCGFSANGSEAALMYVANRTSKLPGSNERSE